MLNILSYIGVNLHSELCLWTILGLLRTIFDATLFKVNSNLKQVWQMTLPPELSMPVQRALRTMISGVMLVQCFTLYVYLAAYIVLLYPVFLEERPTLALPWLLLAAIRRFLCELTSLTLGLGACVLLGPVRPPCIKFVAFKVASITPGFYMWMLVFSYYNTLKVSSAYKPFPLVIVPEDPDYGLELAVRRRRTKSLQDENQLRKKLVASLYVSQRPKIAVNISPRYNTSRYSVQNYRTVYLRESQYCTLCCKEIYSEEMRQRLSEEDMRKKLVRKFFEHSLKKHMRYNYGDASAPQALTPDPDFKSEITVRMAHSTNANFEDIKAEMQESPLIACLPVTTERITSDLGQIEDWCGSELIVPRDADRILEQFAIMMLRIGAYIKAEGKDREKLFNSASEDKASYKNLDCSTMQGDDADTPPQVGNTTGKSPYSYLEEYPQIFMKKPENLQLQSEQITHTNHEKQTKNYNDTNKGDTQTNPWHDVNGDSKNKINSIHEQPYNSKNLEKLDSETNPKLETSNEAINSKKSSKVWFDTLNRMHTKLSLSDIKKIKPDQITLEKNPETSNHMSENAQSMNQSNLQRIKNTADKTNNKINELYSSDHKSLEAESFAISLEAHSLEKTKQQNELKEAIFNSESEYIEPHKEDLIGSRLTSVSDIKIKIEKQIKILEEIIKGLIEEDSQIALNTSLDHKSSNLNDHIKDDKYAHHERVLSIHEKERSSQHNNSTSVDTNNEADYPVSTRSLNKNNPKDQDKKSNE